MAGPTPSFVEQKRLDQSLRDSFRRTIIRLTGKDPSASELDALVRAETADLNRDLGEEHCRELARESAAIPAVPPSTPPAGSQLAGTWLSSDQLKEAESALWFARTHEIASVSDALTWYVNHRHGALDAPPLRQCIGEFMVAKRCEGLRPVSLKTQRIILSKFAAAFGERQPMAVTPREIADYLMKAKTPPIRAALWIALSTFYAWAVRMRYAFDNPVKLAQKQPKSVVPGRFIFTPAEARELLHRAKFTPEIGFWVLALFAGLRATEIKRIQQRPDPWSLINLDTGMIEITRQTAKTRARLIPIRPVLRQWLRWVRFRNYPLYPPGQRDKCRWVRVVIAHRREQTPEDFPNGPGQKDHRFYNIARRSYLSYRLALPEASYAQVADEAGNNEWVLRKYYQRRATRKEALQYFGLTPRRV